ncbi:hypothetical protein TYRP_003005 [Tyrophagus putrescentiae]|nr:hypothetical protein TYRP_003005 [Tyrophagus putrescentiae]
MLSVVALYINNLVIALPLAITHYIQWTTYQHVSSLLQTLYFGNFHDTKIIRQQVKRIAIGNAKLHRLNSFPLLLFFVSNSVDIVLSVCLISIGYEFPFVYIFCTTVYPFTFYTTLVDIITNGDSKWKQFSYEAALFIDFIYIVLPFCVAGYAQLGTLKHLSQLSEQIAGTDNQNAHFIEKVKHSVKEMATINGTVHLLNSPPFAVYLFAIGADTLVNTCRMSVDPDFGYLIFSLIIFAYQLYLCTLTYRTKAVLGKIVQHCEDFEKRNSTETVTLEILKKNLKRKAPVQADSLLGQYESELSITVFRLFTINYRYIFLYSLFLLNHSVFLLQTKTEN